MKKIGSIISTVLWILALAPFVFALHGCGGGDYAAYTGAKIKQAELEQNDKPLLDMSFTDSGGKPMHLVLNLPKERMQIEQQRQNEWAAVVSGGLSTVAPWFGVGYLAKQMSTMGSGNTTNSGTMTMDSGNRRDTMTVGNDGPITGGSGDSTPTTTTVSSEVAP